MSVLSLIIKREFIAKVRNKSFIVMTFLGPLLIVGMTFLIAYLSSVNKGDVKTIGVHDRANVFVKDFKNTEDIKYVNLSNLSFDKAKDSSSNAFEGLIYVPEVQNVEELATKTTYISDDSPKMDFLMNLQKVIDTKLNSIPIRQIQTPIINKGKIVGYLVVAMSLEDFQIVLILKNILLITFPLILILLFLIARFFAGKSIKPVQTIIETSSQITKDNLKTRIPLPFNKDELYVLSENINHLLDRVENAIDREKQFTSDASHELRTPLAVIKGTLEVLIRKPRNQQEYEERIQFCVSEVDRLNHMVDQLLLLARFENQKQNIKKETIYLNALILDNLIRFSDKIDNKKIKVMSRTFAIGLCNNCAIKVIKNSKLSKRISRS